MITLLEETTAKIYESGHVIEDIIFIGSEESGHSCSWDEFKVMASKGYDNSYGIAEVAIDLIIVFSDGQKMWRDEYDGSEWWEVQTPFRKPHFHNRKIKKLITDDIGGNYTLEEMNENKGDIS